MRFAGSGGPVPGDGLWRRLDPRVKIICVVSLAIAVVATPIRFYWKFLGYTAVLLCLTLLARVRLKPYLLRLLFLLPLLFFLAGILLISPGEDSIGKLHILYGLSARTVLTFLSFGILVVTMEFGHIIRGLELMRFPVLITTMLSFAYRYVFLLRSEARRVIRGARARGLERRRGRRRARGAGGLVPGLIFRVLERSRRIYIAMLSRGYRDKMPVRGRFQMRRGDYTFLAFFYLALTSVMVFA